MKSAFIASVAALVATVSAGSAYVVNNCATTVSVVWTPAEDGGATASSTSVASGGTSSQEYTALSNGAGWSIKISDDDNSESPMQFEYTAESDTVWYDNSFFNGDGGIGTWLFTVSDESSCSGAPIMDQFFAYQNPNGTCGGDGNTITGMQPECDLSVDVTLTLCPSDGGASSPSCEDLVICADDYAGTTTTSATATASATAQSSASATAQSSSSATAASSSAAASTTAKSSVATSSTAAAPSSTTAESTASTSKSAVHTHSHPWADDAEATSAASTTTLVTYVSASATASEEVIWVTDVAYVTAYVTADKRAVHRHEHHARHPHGIRA